MRSRTILSIVSICMYLMVCASVPSAEIFPVNDVLITGSRDERVNIVFLAEGYVEAELGQFELDVQEVLNDLFTTQPYMEYQNFFNVYAIEVISPQSGTDHPANADDCPPDMPSFHANTYFNSTFDFGGIHRLLVAKNEQSAHEVLEDNLPEWDVAFIVVNTEYYGGSGGTFATFSMDPAAPEIALHELGHAFANLADEYEYGGLTPYEAPNATAETVRDFIKWRLWIEETTPIPTPETPSYSGVVGLFEGAVYHAIGWYRPKLSCKMRALGVPFCEVCSEQTVLSIYNLVQTTISDYEPIEDSLTVSEGEILEFVIVRMQTVPNTIETEWYVGSELVASDCDTFMFASSVYGAGDYIVMVNAVDNTSLVRNDPDEFLFSTLEWNVTVEENVTAADGAGTTQPRAHLEQNYPNPFNPVTTIRYYLPSGGRVSLKVFDSSGREIAVLSDRIEEAGQKSVTWNGLNASGERVASGVYFFRLTAGDETIVKKTVLLR
jgi:hypothetical protein